MPGRSANFSLRGTTQLASARRCRGRVRHSVAR